MQKGFGVIYLIVGILILGLMVGGYYFYNQQKVKSINSFEECAKYYPVMESYPAQCNTPDGRHFVQELSDEEKKKLVPSKDDETADWKTYTNLRDNYTFRYPSRWIIPKSEGNGESGEILRTSDLKYEDYSEVSKGALIYIPLYGGLDYIQSLDEMLIEAQTGLEAKKTETTSFLLDGQSAKKLIALTATVAEEIIVFTYPKPINKAKYSFIILVSSPGDFEKTKSDFDQILSTFRFSE